ncbi:prenylcysteine oxidase [Exophiala viscosa]|uniref:Prenylcysteine oxidase n=1 Tax=Exophiala viscosa TaxID=2486360 RepID=A0AAN6I8U8_9EURO|nr:prenylcysteine oxidase [Exophiala viscosa]KAI1620364.1 prenylcysteine oxidase [Exophiala viscosa]
MHVRFIACLISFVGSVIADNFQEPLRSPSTSLSKPHRIAVVGAGPGGSATSYYLDKFARSLSLHRPLEITVFDTNTYIGGRTTTVNALEDPRYPTELGASIFVEINHILYNATRDFGLIPSAKIYQAAPDSKYELGIWDGLSFVFTSATEDDTSSWSGWWDIAKLLWKYGLSPIRTQRATRKAVGSFLEFYNEPVFPFPSIQEAVLSTGLVAYTSVTGKDVLNAAGVGDLFSREIIQASTRVNYASNLGGIHGLETLVCMAIEGAMAVEGGNWQIFEEMVTSSATRLLLNTTVTDVIKDTKHGTFTLRTTNPDVNEFLGTEDEAAFDTVVLAAPYQFANISFAPELANPPAKIPYVSLHVTLFTSPHRLSPSFFGLDTQADVPSSILTTLHEGLDEDLSSRRGVDAVGPAGFWSISTLRVLHPDTDGTFFGPTSNHSTKDSQPQYLYKIFSPAPLTGTFLSDLLDFPHSAGEKDDPLSALSKKDVTWLHEKLWHSYPYELPRSTFENFTLLTSSGDDQDQKEGLFYLSGMESFISTMETSALAGMNVARLIVDQLHSQS